MFEIALRTDDGIPRYSVGKLFYDTEDLWLTVYDREVRGRVRFTGSGKARFRRYVDRRHTEDIPKHATPSLWRPFGDWPYELPEPAALVKEQVRPAPKISEPVSPIHLGTGDFWPHAHVRLGRPTEKPECADEAEARYLRAVRTNMLMERVPTVHECVWPQPYVIESVLIVKTLAALKRDDLPWFRPGDRDDFFIDRSELEARVVPFEPTPRDVTEWELGRWKSWRPQTDAGLIESQAQNPPPSFYELADTLSTTVSAITRRYESAKDELYRRATV